MLLKKQIDDYWTRHYKDIQKTTQKLIKKKKRFLDSSEVISHTYLYLVANQQKIYDFSEKNNKTLDHVIWSFMRKHIYSSIYWDNSDVNIENDRLYKRIEKNNNPFKSKDEDTEPEEFTAIAFEQEDDIYTDEFITTFYNTLSKLDKICFKIYYYDGIDNAKDFANHLNISKQSAYNSINKLKNLLKDFIELKKIH